MSVTSFVTANSVLDTREIQMTVEKICSKPLLNPDYCTNSRVGLIAVSIQFEYDPDELATKITTQLVHKSNSKTYV